MTLDEAEAQFFSVRIGRREDFGQRPHDRRPAMLVVVREEGGDTEVFVGPDQQSLLDALDEPREAPRGEPTERLEQRIARLEARLAQLEGGGGRRP